VGRILWLDLNVLDHVSNQDLEYGLNLVPVEFSGGMKGIIDHLFINRVVVGFGVAG
jgi:hypothetical protein